jgi:hypothetical protein
MRAPGRVMRRRTAYHRHRVCASHQYAECVHCQYLRHSTRNAPQRETAADSAQRPFPSAPSRTTGPLLTFASPRAAHGREPRAVAALLTVLKARLRVPRRHGARHGAPSAAGVRLRAPGLCGCVRRAAAGEQIRCVYVPFIMHHTLHTNRPSLPCACACNGGVDVWEYTQGHGNWGKADS